MTRTSHDRTSATDFKAIQYQFTAHIRDPANCQPPADIEDRRLQIYRDLLYNNVESFIANGFPVLRKITADEHWHELIRDYFKTHHARTPLFPKMAQEFLQYLEQERAPHAGDYAFMQELAHYEWLELAISIDTREVCCEALDEQGDLLSGIPVLSPLAWPFVYQFPVHRIAPDYLPEQPPPQATYLLVYRDRKDEVGFLELNPVAARLIEILQAGEQLSGEQILLNIAAEIQHPQAQVVVDGGLQILQSMRDRDIIAGIKKAVR